MKKLAFAALLLGTAFSARAANKIVVTVTNDTGLARPAEVIAVPIHDVQQLLSGVMIDHYVVKDAAGTVLPCQVTNFKPEEHHDYYLDLLFQHDFAAGEMTAVFTIEPSEKPVPPFPSKVFARYVPERFGDFAWENDRLGHRIYGPGLDSPVAGHDRMVSSGVDVWCKRVRYPIVDRWYLKGHYHEDSGEGLDMYNVGTSRGCGGTGVWADGKLHVSGNWASWKVLANGPIRVVFELTYAPWDAGNGIKVSETKRFTVDAGHNLDLIESTFAIEGAGAITVGLGLNKHSADKGQDPKENLTPDEADHALVQWEAQKTNGSIGEAIIVTPGAFRGYAEDALNHLILTTAVAGQPLRYWAGAGWTRSGDFASEADWKAYVADFARRLQSPIKIAKIEAE
jgi:pectinesterase